MMVPNRKSMLFDLPSGTRLGGKYELLRKLATGGMAEIYLARMSGTAGFEKLVVLKRILPSVAEDPNYVQMFLDEARLAARLRHPNIADVYEVGEDDGAPFFAMEFIHGQDVRALRLASHARGEGVPLAISLSIMYATAAALDYAHNLAGPDGRSLQIVHRDVSASNVLVSYEGAVKLIDFGIARASTRRHQTQAGTLKGKIPYMSPEQCRGQSLDRRSDLFSLGIVVYELTTGRRPFIGETDFVVMERIVHHTAPWPSQLVRGYPPELEAMVMRLLAPDPAERYPSAEALLHDLDPFIGQHRLYVPPKAMSNHMRMLFAKQLAGFEDQDLDEVTRVQRILATITGESQNSQQLTPLSSFPAMWPSPAPAAPAAGAAPSSEQLAASRPRRRRLAFALIGLTSLGAGGVVGHQVMERRAAEDAAEPAAAIAPDEPRPAAAEEPRPAPVEARPVEAKATEPGPADPGAAAARPDPAPPEPRSAEPTPAEPTPAEPRPAAKRPPRSAPIAQPKSPSRPAASREAPPKEASAPPPPPPAPPPPKEASKPPDRPKDSQWDKNDKDSPFLPN